MTKKNKKNNEQNNEECTYGLCSGDRIYEILNMLASSIRIDSNDMLGLPSNLIDIGMIMMGGALPCSDPECNRARCQSQRWDEKDKVATEDVFEDDKAPILLVKLPNHRKVKKLISLREKLAEDQADHIFWNKIVEDNITEEDDKPIFDQLSDSSKTWIRRSAMTALSAAKAGGRSGKKVIKEVTTLPIFIEVMAGKKTYKNEAFNDTLKEIREVAVKSESVDIQTEIDKIIDKLPDGPLKEATEIPTLSISLEELESVIRKYRADLGGL